MARQYLPVAGIETWLKGVMGKVPSKLYKMKITLVSHFSRYIFTKITYGNTIDSVYSKKSLGFNHSFQMTSEPPASLSDGLLV